MTPIKNVRQLLKKRERDHPSLVQVLLNVLPFISIALGIIVWEFGTRGLPSLVLAPPSEVVEAWIQLVTEGVLVTAIMKSFRHMFLGYIIAVIFAIPLGILIAQSETIKWMVNPYIDALYATPTIAYLPLVIVWFGLGFKARVFYVFVSCFFEVLLNTYQGVSSIEKGYFTLSKSFGLSWFERQRKILLPASYPHIFTGLRIGVGRAVRAMIAAEIFLAVVNLGAILESSTSTFRTDRQLAVIVTISLIGVVFQATVQQMGITAVPWAFNESE